MNEKVLVSKDLLDELANKFKHLIDENKKFTIQEMIDILNEEIKAYKINGVSYNEVDDVIYIGNITPTKSLSTYGQKNIEVRGNDSNIYITQAENCLIQLQKSANIELFGYNENVITNIENFGNSKVNAENLTPENIKKDVYILGVKGSHEGGIKGVTELDNGNTLNIAKDYSNIFIYTENKKPTIWLEAGDRETNYKQIEYSIAVDLNQTPYEIAKVKQDFPEDDLFKLDVYGSVEFLRINGSHDIEFTGENNNTYISFVGENSENYIYLNNGEDDFELTIKTDGYGYDSVEATNLEPQNIKKGVTILGVTGTYEGE